MHRQSLKESIPAVVIERASSDANLSHFNVLREKAKDCDMNLNVDAVAGRRKELLKSEGKFPTGNSICFGRIDARELAKC